MVNIKTKVLLALVVLFVLANISVWGAVYANAPSGMLTVAFLDVGQGDSIFVRAPNGNEVLVDAGHDGQALRDLGHITSFFDRSIDVVVPTHPDADHIGGMFNILSHYDVGVALLSGAHSDTEIDDELHADLKRRGVKMMHARSGTIIDLGSGVLFEIVSPNFNPEEMPKTNNASIVGKLTYGDTSFLLTGDAPSEVEKYLVERYGTRLKTDILKAGHHGSKYSSSNIFLKEVMPKYTVISVGAKNDYGQPAPEALKRIRESGSKILMTKERGTIIFRSDGKKIYLLPQTS